MEIIRLSRKFLRKHYEREGWGQYCRYVELRKDKMMMFYRNYKRLITALEFVNASSGERILDVGCGPGVYVLQIAKRGANTVGLDIARLRIKQLKFLGSKENLTKG